MSGGSGDWKVKVTLSFQQTAFNCFSLVGLIVCDTKELAIGLGVHAVSILAPHRQAGKFIDRTCSDSELSRTLGITYYKKLSNCPRELTSLAEWRRKAVSAPSIHNLLNARTSRFSNFQTT